MHRALKFAGLTAVCMAVAGCPGDDDEQSNNTEQQTETAVVAEPAQSWDEQYVIDLENIEIVLPNNRLFHLDVTTFVPSVISDDLSMEDYAEAARAVIGDKAQYYVDVYACRSHGNTFYAYMPTSTAEAELPFTSAASAEDVNPEVLFAVENMQTRFENFGNDEFTVHRAEHVGERARDFTAAMEEHIAQNRGNHRPQDPTCSAQYKFNLGE